MSASQPNILLIVTDQQRWDTISAYGLNSICRTPYIDALAQRGVRFDNAFTPISLCSPARASLYTGLYPHKHGVVYNGLCLKEGIRGLNHYLDEASYRCGYAGKWHVDEDLGPSDLGFVSKDFMGYAFPPAKLLPGLQFSFPAPKRGNPYKTYLEERGFGLPWVTERFVGTNPGHSEREFFALHNGPVESCVEYFVAEETIRIINESNSEDAPFFIWANFWGPHSLCLVPEPYFSMYNPADIPEHPSYRETFEKKPYRQQIIEKMWGLGKYGWRGFQEITARYYGHCTLIDDMVGRIVNHLEQLDIADNTVIIFTSDHGDCMGAHKLIEKGAFMYDETYRIPLVVAHPNCQQPGSVNDDFVYLHDLASSIIDVAGLSLPQHLDGQSILPAMLGDHTPNGREEVYCVFSRLFTEANQRMIRTRRHQFTFNSADPGELYDLAADPYQLNNVYGQVEYEEVRLDLMARMDRYMRELEDPLYRWYKRLRPVY